MAEWLSLIEFSARRGISISTLRRYIKSGRIQFKNENGRYLILDNEGSSRAKGRDDLESDLQRAHEEIAELKMLIALYEEKISTPRLNT